MTKINQNLESFTKHYNQIESILSNVKINRDVFVFAQGGSMLSCKALVEFKAIKNIYFVTSVSEEYLKHIPKKSLFVFISNSGKSPETLKQIEFFQKNNILNKDNSILFSDNYALISSFKGKSFPALQCLNFTSRFGFLSLPTLFVAHLAGFNIMNFYLGCYFANLRMIEDESNILISVENLHNKILNCKLLIFACIEDSLLGLLKWKRHLAIEIFCHGEKTPYFDIFETNFDFHSKIQQFCHFNSESSCEIVSTNEDDFSQSSLQKFKDKFHQNNIPTTQKTIISNSEFMLGKYMFEEVSLMIKLSQLMSLKSENQQKFIDEYKYSC